MNNMERNPPPGWMHDPWQEWTSGILQSDLTTTTSRGLAAAYAITFARTADLAHFAPLTYAVIVAFQHGNAARERLEQEIYRRLRSGTKTWATMLAETMWGQSDLTLHKLMKDLHIEGLSDYRSNDPRDLQSDAIMGAAEKYRELAGPDLPHDRDRFVARLAGQIAALLEFNVAGAARDGYRSEFERRAAKKRGGSGGRHAKKAGTKQGKAEAVEYRDELENSIIDPVTGAERERRSPEDDALEKERKLEIEAQGNRAMRMAQKRWGAKGRAFLEALKRSANVAEASAMVGVSRQMGRKYLSKLKADLKTRE
jgi:hypothetical protein